MSRFARIEVATTMHNTGLVPVFYHGEIEICKRILHASYLGGARVFEFTNRGDFAHEVFAALNRYCKQECPEMILGIGSVLDTGTASLYLQLGAAFVVSPVLDASVAEVCNRRKILWAPGCGTISEISRAESLGAEVVKIFPAAQVGGPSFVKAVKGPMPWSSIMPTGGVSPDKENLKAWFDAGVHCVGIGSKLFVKDDQGGYDYDAITAKVEATLNFIKSLRYERL